MTPDPHRDAVIDAMLPHIPFDGWTERSVARALVALGEPPEDAPLMFPGGPGEMIEAFSALADQRMAEAAERAGFATYRLPARVRAIIAIRLEQNRGHREAIRRAIAWLALPRNARRGLRITAATVDAIWHAAGDRSADFSWYTKRAILAGVYTSTILYWLRDRSEEDADTLAFLSRRLEAVGTIGKLRKRFTAPFAGLRGRGSRPRGL